MKDERGRLTRAIDAVATGFARLAQAGLSYLLVLLLAPIFAGSAIWYARGGIKRLGLLDTNKLRFEDQLAAAVPMGVTVGATLVVLLAVWAVLRWRRGLPFARFGAAASAWLLPLLAVPFALSLFQKGIEKESPVVTLFFAAIIGVITGVSAYRVLPSRPLDEGDTPVRVGLDRLYEALSWAAVLAIGVAYGWFFTKLSITNHHALVSRTIDLGLYDNIFYQSIHGRPLACTFLKAGYHGSAHFDPILVLLSPLYLLYPRAEFILGLQSVWIASGVIPIFLIARSQLQSRPLGVMLAAVYALHPALHGANMYEFHSLTLACVPMLWTLWALSTNRFRAYWVLLGVSLLVREDIPLMMSMVGVTCTLLPGGRLRRLGLVTIGVCAAYFLIVKAFFMTSSGIIMSGPEAYSYAYYYAELIPGGKGMGGMLLSLVTNPTFALRHALEREKLLFLATIFLPLALAPFAARSWRLTLIYGIAFTTLATRTAVFSTHFQYSNSILPFAFFATPVAIRQLSEGTLAKAYGLDAARLRRALVVAALFTSLGVSFKFGGIVDNDAFRGGFARVVRELSDQQREHYAWVEATAAMIPKEARVGVTNKLGPHVSNRQHAYFYGQKTVEYVFVDEQELKADRLKRHRDDVNSGKLVELARRRSYALYRTKEAPEGAGDTDEDVTQVLGDEQKDP